MTQRTRHVENEVEAPDLASRLRGSGMVVAFADAAGLLMVTSGGNEDWLTRLILTPRLIHQAVGEAAKTWAAQADPCCTELIPGCWCSPIPLSHRRKRTGYGLIFIPSVDLLASEHLRAMCQAAALDFESCRRLLEPQLPSSATEVLRLGHLAGLMFRDQQRLESATRTMNSVGQQLAESYEEISLLYTITQSMNVVQQPKRFVLSACQGLLDTLTYRWIGAQFGRDVGALASLEGRLIVAGDGGVTTEGLSRLTTRLLDMVHPDAPVVIDPESKPEHADFAPLGRPVLVHPICREGRMLGVLIAADKLGSDRAASSADMKLLGAAASHTGIFLENAALYEDMDAMFLGTLEALTASIDAKDRYTCGHSQRVAHLSAQLATALGLDEDVVRRVHVAGLVHDVGKIGVPESVLCKPGRLTDEEFDCIKKHPEIGHRILKDIPQLRDVLPGVLHHHERWDGRGYPHALHGSTIPLFARLIALSDSFDAMSSTRTYRSARERAWVLEEIRVSAGTQFDPELVPLFLSLDFSEFDHMISDHRADEQARGVRLGDAA